MEEKIRGRSHVVIASISYKACGNTARPCPRNPSLLLLNMALQDRAYAERDVLMWRARSGRFALKQCYIFLWLLGRQIEVPFLVFKASIVDVFGMLTPHRIAAISRRGTRLAGSPTHAFPPRKRDLPLCARDGHSRPESSAARLRICPLSIQAWQSP